MLYGKPSHPLHDHLYGVLGQTGRPLRIIALILVLLSIIGLTGRMYWWADLLGYPRWHFLGLLIPISTYYLLRHQWHMGLFCLAGIGCNIFVIGISMPYTTIPTALASSASSGGIKVATLNVNVSNTNTAAVLDWVHAEKPDILLLVEANRHWLPVVDQLIESLPYRRIADHSSQYGLILLSRFPLDNSTTTRAGPYSLPTLSAKAETPIGELTILGVHPNPVFNTNDYQATRMYMAQVSAMARTNDTPTLLMGDFSSVPWSFTFENIRNLPNLQPSVWQVSATWPANLGMLGLPLDQILLTTPAKNQQGIKVENIEAGPQIQGTDHRPLIAHLKINHGLTRPD